MQKAALYRYARIILSAIYLTAAALIQCSVFPHIRLLGVIPDFALCAVACVSCFEEKRVSCVFAVSVGFLLDVAGGAVYVFSPAVFLLVCAVALIIRDRLPTPRVVSAASAVLTGALITGVITAVILSAKGAPFSEAFIHTSLPEILYTAIVFFPTYLLTKLHYTVFKNEKL